jgi:hypothetical protein
MVTLAEQLYLLAEDAATGRPLIDPTHVGRGLGGALLLDLALRRRVALVESCVVTTSTEPTGEPLLDAAHTTIARQTRTHGPDHWVRHLARGAHAAVQEHLIVIGVLRREDRRILQVIHVHRTRETDGRLHHCDVGSHTRRAHPTRSPCQRNSLGIKLVDEACLVRGDRPDQYGSRRL